MKIERPYPHTSIHIEKGIYNKTFSVYVQGQFHRVAKNQLHAQRIARRAFRDTVIPMLRRTK